MSNNHNTARILAGTPASTVRSVDTQRFAEAIQSIARRLILATPHKTKEDAQFLQDVARGRYQLRAFERLTTIAQQSTRPALKDELAGLVLLCSSSLRDVPPLRIAARDETEAQGICDIAVHDLEHAPTRANKLTAMETIRTHVARLTVLFHAVERLTVL